MTRAAPALVDPPAMTRAAPASEVSAAAERRGTSAPGALRAQGGAGGSARAIVPVRMPAALVDPPAMTTP